MNRNMDFLFDEESLGGNWAVSSVVWVKDQMRQRWTGSRLRP